MATCAFHRWASDRLPPCCLSGTPRHCKGGVYGCSSCRSDCYIWMCHGRDWLVREFYPHVNVLYLGSSFCSPEALWLPGSPLKTQGPNSVGHWNWMYPISWNTGAWLIDISWPSQPTASNPIMGSIHLIVVSFCLRFLVSAGFKCFLFSTTKHSLARLEVTPDQLLQVVWNPGHNVVLRTYKSASTCVQVRLKLIATDPSLNWSWLANDLELIDSFICIYWINTGSTLGNIYMYFNL